MSELVNESSAMSELANESSAMSELANESSAPSTDHLDIARAFIEQWGRGGWADLRGAYETYLHDDCVYENSGLPTVTGKAAILGLIDQLAAAQPVGAIVATIRSIAAAGDLVYSERSDRHLDADGNHAYTVDLLGVMQLREGKIVSWREYFDPRPMLTAVGATA